ncbi:hypothetical protein PR048_033497 [Dryococelus australis]|uniref:Uncharacterized protein n=1 Tax=Dryococelus australis TaxID=614101 RepID=A0ABQ9G0F9_9NEOP|nr:hypothetical protein PR048_033497 [Dryococelus australis]
MPLVGGVSSGISRFAPPLHFGTAPYSRRFSLIGSQDLDVNMCKCVSKASQTERFKALRCRPPILIRWNMCWFVLTASARITKVQCRSYRILSGSVKCANDTSRKWRHDNSRDGSRRLRLRRPTPLTVKPPNHTTNSEAIPKLACVENPPTKANRLRFPVGSLRISVPDDAASRRVFSGISRFPRPHIPGLLHTHFTSPLLALTTSLLRVAPISSLTIPRVFRGSCWQQARLDSTVYTRDIIVCLLVADIQWNISYRTVLIPAYYSLTVKRLVSEQLPSNHNSRRKGQQGRRITPERNGDEWYLLDSFHHGEPHVDAENGVVRSLSRRATDAVIAVAQDLDAWSGLKSRSLRTQAVALSPEPPRPVEIRDHTPPTKTNRVQFPAGSLPVFHMWNMSLTLPLTGRFSRGISVPSAITWEFSDFRRCDEDCLSEDTEETRTNTAVYPDTVEILHSAAAPASVHVTLIGE